MYKTNRGFTLIEFLVAIVILMVGLLGLLQTVNVAIQHNMQNQYRNEATIIADKYMASEIAKGYEGAQNSNSKTFVQKSYSSGFGLKNYSVERGTPSDPTGAAHTYSNSKEIIYRVTWRYKGVKYDHSISTVISQTN